MDSAKVSFETDTQINAYTAGRKDRAMQDLAANERSENAVVYDGTFTENEFTKNFTKQDRILISTVAKSFGMDISTVDKIIANELTGAEANALHKGGKMEISNNRDAHKAVFRLILHEGGHRMSELAPEEFGALMNALYKFSTRANENVGRSQTSGFDNVKSDYDRAGLTMDTLDYFEEFAVQEIEGIFGSARAFNRWYAEISGNQQARTAWQKIVDYIFEIIDDIKRALSQAKLSKADRAEANAQLERIKELYANAYKAAENAVAEKVKTQANQGSAETQKNTDTEGNLSFDLKTFDGKSIVWIEESGLTNKQLNNHQAVAEYIEQHIGDVYTIIESGQKVYIGEELPQEYTQSKYTTYLRNVNRTAARGKNKAIDGFGELIETATNRRWEKTKHAQNKDAKYGMYRYDNSFAFPIKDNKGKVTNIRAFDVELLIRNASDGNKYLYDIVGIKENTTTEIGILERMTRLPAERQATRDSVSNEIVSQNSKSVKSDFSLKEKETNVENIPQFSLKASNNGIYDYTKSFAQQVDDWKNGLIPQNDSLLVGATPKVFKKIGFNPLPFTINQRHIDYAINGTKDIDHSLGETLLAQLPQALENPLAIISSQTQSDRVVAILKIQHKGKNIVAPVEIDGYGTQNNVSIDSNAITSVFGKGNAITKLLTDALNSEIKGSISVFYWNKKEALSLLQTPGLQLPSHLPQDGFIHSITEKGSPVKQRLKNITESQQFKRWFGNSKVVNKDGTPKILYHQTANDFTVFDTRHEGAGRSDNETPFGIFLKPTSEKIGVKGDIQMPLYANIRNPLEVANRGELAKALQTMSSDFANLYEEHKRLDKEYQSKFDEATKQFREYITKWRAANPDASRQAIYDDPGFNEVFEAEGKITDEWSAVARVLELKTKEVITKALKDNDYDGVHLLEDAGSFGKTTETYIALEPTQVKSATDNIGTFDNSNPDIQYSLKGTLSDSEIRNAITDKKLHKYVDKGIITTEKYDELVKTYGAIPSGENPHRDVQVPQKTAKDKKVSQTVRTILEAKATPDEAVPTIEKMVEDGVFSYDVYTDKQALDEANSNIEKYGWDESIDDWFKDVEKGIVSKQHTAMGWALYNNAANIAATTTSETERTSAIKTSLKILDAMVRHQRSAAQALQATRILKKLSPETVCEDGGVKIEKIIKPSDTDCFIINRITVSGGKYTIDIKDNYGVYIVTNGDGEIMGVNYHKKIKKGDYFFMSAYSMGRFSIEGNLEVVECY